MNTDYDVCVIGSGAGAGPVYYQLALAGFSVLVLEKGPFLTENDFFKDELAASLRRTYHSNLQQEPHVVETETDEGQWQSRTTDQSSWDFWNGNCVGGSSNFMSGFFHRMKPIDFKLRSTFGPIEDAQIVDWPISYADLEPYYEKVERIVGVSGTVIQHPFAEPRSTPDYPFPPTQEHPITKIIDQTCHQMNLHPIPTPRAILPHNALNRHGCSYSGYCGSYGCSTNAKGSARAALLYPALATKNCQVISNAMVSRLVSDHTGKITEVRYYDQAGKEKKVDAKIYVVACQAIETARLLLNSTGPKHQNGLANYSGLVGKNLIFAGGGAGSGRLVYADYETNKAAEFNARGPFINRALQDWYVIDDPAFGPKQKGGTIDFLLIHPNPVSRAMRQTRGRQGLVWGKPLKRQLESHFLDNQYLKIEAFCDWLPVSGCFMSIDPKTKDKWGLPVAKIRIDFHVRNLQLGWYLAQKGGEVLKTLGAKNVVNFAVGSPPTNLVAGTCRFGKNPETAVLNENCQAHDVENLYLTDGSFMPTGGSAPYTNTIYANAFRVADKIIEHLGNVKDKSRI